MKHKAIQKTAHPDWTFTSPNDWMRWIKTQAALNRAKIKLNVIICPSL